MVAGVGYVSPRPICDACQGEGTLEPSEPLGEYPPPPRDSPVVDLSEDQKKAVEGILGWFQKIPDKRAVLAGYAGTGKTTIIVELLKQLRGKCIVKVCAPTGKAASVLRHKGVHATTLHKLIYAPENVCSRCFQQVQGIKGFDKKLRCPNCKTETINLRWIRVPLVEADLVIIDESSMLSTSMVEDIESLAGKILYVGDHGQLEPIGDDPRIMREADMRLETIHRQAAQSGIIQLAHHMRRGSHPNNWEGDQYDDARVAGISKLIPRILARYDIVLCGYNKTRKAVNAAIRGFRGFDGALPQVGERLICLQNDSDLGIFNGLLVTVVQRRKSYTHPCYDLIDDAGNEYFDVMVQPDQFTEERKIEYNPKGIGLFDFGYCLTVHKCVTGDTLIETKDAGWTRIDKLADHKNRQTGTVATISGNIPFNQFVEREEGEILRLECEGGYSVSVTPDHKMRSFAEGTSSWEWVEAHNLNRGDFLRLRLGPVMDGRTGDVPLPPCPTGDVRARSISTPSTLTPDVAEFLGLMVADGTKYKSGIRLAKRYPDVVQRFAKLGENIFGIEAKFRPIEGTPSVEFNSTLLSEWLRLVGGMEPHAKFIPAAIMRAPKGLRPRFFRGLFEDGTVNVKDDCIDHIEWANADPEFVRTVQILLLEIGIISSINTKKRTPSLYIYSDGISIFRDLIGFVAKSKNQRLRNGRVAKNTRHRVPIDPADFDWRTSVGRNARRRGYVSRASALDLEMHDELLYHYVRIKNITRESGPSYCLSVPKSGSFLQNRFDGSNSQGSEWDSVAVIEQIARAWDPARWRYTAATRAAKRLEYWLPLGRL